MCGRLVLLDNRQWVPLHKPNVICCGILVNTGLSSQIIHLWQQIWTMWGNCGPS